MPDAVSLFAFSSTLDFCFRHLLSFFSDLWCMQWKSSLSIPFLFFSLHRFACFLPPVRNRFCTFELGYSKCSGLVCCYLFNFIQRSFFILPSVLCAECTANNHPSLYITVAVYHFISSPLGKWKWWSGWDHSHCWAVLGLLQRSLYAHRIFVRCHWTDIRCSTHPHLYFPTKKLNNLVFFNVSFKQGKWNSTCSSRQRIC